MKNLITIQEFINENESIYTFVLNSRLDIIQSNMGITGNLSNYLNGEDRHKINERIFNKQFVQINFFLNLKEQELIPLKANITKKEANLYVIAFRCSVNDFFEENLTSSTEKLKKIKLDISGNILESNHETYLLKKNLLRDFSSENKNEILSAFIYCIKHQRVTGFEQNVSDNFDASTLYRFIPETIDGETYVHLLIKNFNFNNTHLLSNNYFQDLIDSTADFIYKTDVHGNFVFLNETAKKRYGFYASANKKSNFKDWIREDYRALVEKFYLNQFLSKTETTYLELPTITDRGEEIWVGQNVRMVFSGDWVLSVQTSCRDITENKIIESELMEIQSKNQAILDSIPDSMYLFDDSFVLLDKKIEEDSNFFDMNIGEDINSSNLINLNLEKIKECIIDCLENQKLVKLELVSFINEEEEIFDIRLAPVNEFQALILIRNITARIYQQRKLQKSQEKEREALDAKQRYLSFMTHEIRTPLNAIVGLTDLIFDTNPTPKQMEYLKSIRSSSSILSKIINDVLDFNKLENNKIRLDEIVFNIQTVFKDVIRTCTVYSYNKPLTLSYDIDKRIPSILKGDAFKLTQVLTNLISNAIKFTPKGRVTANANLLQLEDNQVIIKFEVKDTGIGIPKDKQDRVFNSYEQLESSISRKFGGTGLGLTISQKFVELMGGKIELESELNQGSIFTFIIPFELSKEELKKEAQLARVDFSPYHILLVEDNDMNQLVMGKYFNKWGISYDIAENGEEALKLIEEVEYNLILLDLEMPIMDGFETAIHIRGHENADISSTPILALSASVFSEVEEHTKAIGFNGFIGKPINANYIYKKISEYLIKDLIVEDVESTPVANVHALDIHFTSFDLSYLLETSLNDAKYIRKMVDLFVSKTPDYIKELYHLYEEENYLELRKLAHKFKASVAIMGVQRAEIAIHNLETNISNNIKYDQIPSQLKIIKESSLLACKELKELLETNRFF